MNDVSRGGSGTAAGPLDRYRAEVERGQLRPDPSQELAVRAVQRVYDELLERERERSGALARLRGWLGRQRPEPVRGLYLWGDVGRGKSVIMNLFHDALPFPQKLRIHFHAFMQRVHGDLKAIGHHEDPLSPVADGLAARIRVLCFDEFHVADIADAMLLGRLLDALFERGVTLVATSNSAPRDLYRGGLQRQRFIPAIELLERHTDVLHLGGGIDYRLRALERAEIYHCPLDDDAEVSLREAFDALAPEHVVRDAALEVSGREIAARALADGVAWFAFTALCDGPRGTADYLEIARRFHTVLVSAVPRLDDQAVDRTLRFIHLVDTFYDHNVNLIVSAAAAPAELYAGRRLADRFARTRSRLEEMRSREYLAREHLP